MTDYFALLAQPRSAWLDADPLKAEFHRRAKAEHPDSSSASDAAGVTFAELNTAYRTLSDPASRLAHLLLLSGIPNATISEPPAELADLFFETATIIQRRGGESTAGEQHLARLGAIRTSNIESLREIDVSDVRAIQAAHERLVYLDRWIEQLAERVLAL